MTDDLNQSRNLRRRAEDRLQIQPQQKAVDDLPRLVHELQVYQIELEIQNEELVKSRSNLETLLERYTELYDFAPVGYVSLEPDDNISHTNLACAKMLGLERGKLQNKRFSAFVAESDKPAFRDFLHRIFTSGSVQQCILKLVTDDQLTMTVQMEAQLDKCGQGYLASITDISALKKMEAEITAQRDNLDVAVDERTAELRKTLQLMAGRENRMSELKTTVKKLRKQLLDAEIEPVADDPIYEK